jgi:hypothetical protein
LVDLAAGALVVESTDAGGFSAAAESVVEGVDAGGFSAAGASCAQTKGIEKQ